MKAKRRKIIEALSKGKSQVMDSGNKEEQIIPDTEISLQEMENQFY